MTKKIVLGKRTLHSVYGVVSCSVNHTGNVSGNGSGDIQDVSSGNNYNYQYSTYEEDHFRANLSSIIKNFRVHDLTLNLDV
jgi:hypothetical protein